MTSPRWAFDAASVEDWVLVALLHALLAVVCIALHCVTRAHCNRKRRRSALLAWLASLSAPFVAGVLWPLACVCFLWIPTASFGLRGVMVASGCIVGAISVALALANAAAVGCGCKRCGAPRLLALAAFLVAGVGGGVVAAAAAVFPVSARDGADCFSALWLRGALCSAALSFVLLCKAAEAEVYAFCAKRCDRWERLEISLLSGSRSSVSGERMEEVSLLGEGESFRASAANAIAPGGSKIPRWESVAPALSRAISSVVDGDLPAAGEGLPTLRFDAETYEIDAPVKRISTLDFEGEELAAWRIRRRRDWRPRPLACAQTHAVTLVAVAAALGALLLLGERQWLLSGGGSEGGGGDAAAATTRWLLAAGSVAVAALLLLFWAADCAGALLERARGCVDGSFRSAPSREIALPLGLAVCCATVASALVLPRASLLGEACAAVAPPLAPQRAAAAYCAAFAALLAAAALSQTNRALFTPPVAAPPRLCVASAARCASVAAVVAYDLLLLWALPTAATAFLYNAIGVGMAVPWNVTTADGACRAGSPRPCVRFPAAVPREGGGARDALWRAAPLTLLALAPSLLLAWATFSHMHSFRCAPSLPRGCGFARRVATGAAVALVAAPASAFALLCTPPALLPAACDDALLIAARAVAATVGLLLAGSVGLLESAFGWQQATGGRACRASTSCTTTALLVCTTALSAAALLAAVAAPPTASAALLSWAGGTHTAAASVAAAIGALVVACATGALSCYVCCFATPRAPWPPSGADSARAAAERTEGEAARGFGPTHGRGDDATPRVVRPGARDEVASGLSASLLRSAEKLTGGRQSSGIGSLVDSIITGSAPQVYDDSASSLDDSWHVRRGGAHSSFGGAPELDFDRHFDSSGASARADSASLSRAQREQMAIEPHRIEVVRRLDARAEVYLGRFFAQRSEEVSVLLCTVTYYANRAHNLTRSP